MLENFRKKDVSRPGYTPSPSPYGRMQEALSHPPAAEPPQQADRALCSLSTATNSVWTSPFATYSAKRSIVSRIAAS